MTWSKLQNQLRLSVSFMCSGTVLLLQFLFSFYENLDCDSRLKN